MYVKLVQEYELPYPCQKEEGEKEDAWALKDGKGGIVLKLRFQVATVDHFCQINRSRLP